MVKRCALVIDLPDGPVQHELTLPDEADIAAALMQARELLPGLNIDWEHAPVGLYGRVEPRSAIPQDGDRIELYRRLLLDPRASRRARAARNPGKR